MFNKQEVPGKVRGLRSALRLFVLLVASINAKAQGVATLPYRSVANPLTVAELAALQRKKLEQDFYKKAGFATVPPAQTSASQAKSAWPKKALQVVVPTKPRHILVLVGIYGPAGAEKAEWRYDGQTHIANRGSRMGLVTVESLTPGSAGVLAQHAGRGQSYVLRPGDTLEVSE